MYAAAPQGSETGKEIAKGLHYPIKFSSDPFKLSKLVINQGYKPRTDHDRRDSGNNTKSNTDDIRKFSTNNKSKVILYMQIEYIIQNIWKLIIKSSNC